MLDRTVRVSLDLCLPSQTERDALHDVAPIVLTGRRARLVALWLLADAGLLTITDEAEISALQRHLIVEAAQAAKNEHIDAVLAGMDALAPLRLPDRVTGPLSEAHVRSIADLAALDVDELRALPGIGRVAIARITAALETWRESVRTRRVSV